MRHRWLLTLLALAAALATAAEAATPKAVLKVIYWPHGSAGTPITWTLRCGPIGGSHPARRLACGALAKHPGELRPATRACTLMPTATSARAAIKGTWTGTRVNRSYRIGCPGWSDLHLVLTGK
jgi:Subtilisin inhibitor-like